MTLPGGQRFPYGPQQNPQYGYGRTPPPPPARARRSALTWILAGVSVACVLALVAGGIWWFTSHAADDASGPVPGQLTSEFPTAPSVSWKVTAAATGHDAQQIVGVAGQDKTYMVANRALNENGSIMAVFVGAGDSSRLVLVDTVTGQTRTVPGTFGTCSERIVAGAIACISSPQTSPEVVIVDTNTGERRSIASLDSSSQIIGIGRLAVFAGSRGGSGQQRALIRYDLSGKVLFRNTFDPAEGFGSGDAWGLTVTDSLVALQSGGAITHFRADTGEMLFTRAGYGREPLPDGGLVTSTTTGKDLTSVTSRDVVHTAPSGTQRTFPASSVEVPEVVGPDIAAPFLVDGKLYIGDQARWSSALSNSPQVHIVADDVTVVTHDGRLRGMDTESGRELRAADPGGFRDPVTDGRHVMYITNGSIVAVDLHTGREQWRAPVPMDTKGGTLAAAGGTLVFQTNDGIIGYTATGGAASAPGSRNTGTAAKNSSDDSYYTRCGSKPVFTPQKFRTESGGLVVTMKVTATCPGGDALTSSGTTVTISDSTGPIASGSFDFAANPVGVPKPGTGSGSEEGTSGTTVDLLFKHGQFFRTPDTLPGPSSGGSGASGSGGHSYLVDCVQPEGAGRAKVPAPSDPPIAASGPGPQTGLNPMSGLSALRIQADSDKSFILGSLNNRWVAQLSSKRVGLVADGRTWDEKSILDEFLALRLRFADVRLLYSDEWPVFNYQGWWVSVAAATFPGPDEANQWCRSNGFDRDHCFAKLVSSTASPQGSTRYW
ncbi:PQQ-binding-like beta-propeller repeat protein [Tsukamurella asaccharolytica]|uniref:PQQ-binding-like beta-propeller repeat protein n=1 Tax=Tsukamurella asaccharolytica TaxID=2592067 RepID=A0A5C5R7X4_9ACTN|nr:PQQ-binding-like beta-propeller repeat protein [Tsukamurella asaccharolytica]TWS18271.1 PQQ-binding-like beta-propeller repeat protein [Tsukamurella asaccharolytica]